MRVWSSVAAVRTWIGRPRGTFGKAPLFLRSLKFLWLMRPRQCLQLSHVLPDAKGVGQRGALGMAVAPKEQWQRGPLLLLTSTPTPPSAGQ
jgi:hypothetical protein